ncbi:MAG: cytochrome c3 family protein, partial [Bacteroidota bacterium]
MKRPYELWLAVAFLALAFTSSVAQENSDCLGCHNDKSLAGQRKGKTISVFVDEKNFGASKHGSLACISCHKDVEGKELPHEEELAAVDCGTCHTKEQ